ncbi:glycosyltransferase family 2 protein [Agrococcus casei]|uniref:glycosyltransferase family 2 protein n=1 Tax=Agrococcus casei TaxID=343512 RepID=UPI003F8F55A8
MQSRVMAVIANRNGEGMLAHTLSALEAQTLAPVASVGVDVASTDASVDSLKKGLDTVVRLRSRVGFGQAVRHGVAELPDADEGDWLWFLAHDAAPAPDALEALMQTVEANRLVAVVGPKVMRADDSATVNEFGETMTPLGASVRLAAGDLDQGQHDDRSDVLGVAASGMLVRRDVFEQLGGFDPALPSIDAGLDLGVRARLAGHQVSVQPFARIRRNGGAELFSVRSVSDASFTGLSRRAQLHRRFAYSHAAALVFHWLLLLPQAVIRSIGHLFAKRPAAILSEFGAAFSAMFAFGAVSSARSRIRQSRTAAWSDLAPLRISHRAMRARRRLAGDDVVVNSRVADERVGFVQGGTLWVLALALLAGVIISLPLLTSTAVTGGGLLQLGGFTDIWNAALWSDRESAGGLVAPADPLQILLALLGTLTFWQPSLAVLILLVIAPVLASITAWALARRLTRVKWVPAVVAAVWALAPTLLVSMHDGRIGAVIAHIALPLIAYAVVRARDLVRTAALGAVALAVATAGAPSLLPALVGAVVVAAIWFAVRARFSASIRLLIALVPTAALFGPLLFANLQRGTPLALFADPGVPFDYAAPDAAVLAAQLPDASLGTIATLFDQFGLAGGPWPMWVTLALVAPLALAAFAAPFMRAGHGIAGIAVALAGFSTAVVSAGTTLAAFQGVTSKVWTGPGVSLMLLGLVIAASATLGVLDFRGKAPGAILALFAVVSGGAIVAGAAVSPAVVSPLPERTMPALVSAAASDDPMLGTLVIAAGADETFSIEVIRGDGTTLGDVQTFHTTAEAPTGQRSELSQLAVDLISGGTVDASEQLQQQGIGFIVLRDAEGSAVAAYDSTQRSLNQRADLQSVGQTDAGLLWKTEVEQSGVEAQMPAWSGWLLAGQLILLAIALVLAMPAIKRGARSRVTRAKDVRKDYA